jgi:hypothetical protein
MAPCIRRHSYAYAEHDGWKRQTGPKMARINRDNVSWYKRTSIISTHRMRR